MPVPSFLSSIADKATSAINQTPLAGHIPGTTAPDQPSANSAASQGGHRSVTIDAFQHQLRALGQQYSGAGPMQRIITVEKGIAIDFDCVARDSKAQSKELYTWGQGEDADIKDVTDRLAYLNFIQGSLASSLAVKLDASRASIKALRDAENAIAPRRNARAGLQTQIGRIEHDQQKGMEQRLSQLRKQLAQAEEEDTGAEKQIELLKRKAVRESEEMKWDAIREYGEKLILLSHASKKIIGALPSIPPSQSSPYQGANETGAARASLQRALDNYKTGHISLHEDISVADLSRSDTRSFGETHASEIASNEAIEANHPGLSVTPPLPSPPPSSDAEKPRSPASSPPASSPPIDLHALNQSPASIPTVAPTASSPTPIDTTAAAAQTKLPSSTPTIAETGVPVSAGSDGPGPASGSLHNVKAADPTAGPRSGGLPGSTPPLSSTFGQPPNSSGVSHESAEDEKKRLEREERERVLAAAGTSSSHPGPLTPAYESAEDEKKRLEREEVEHVRATAGHSADADGQEEGKRDGEQLPPYQDFQG
ncbi:hypothetical protein CONPUDRAFT_45222 [Coniophora puteana RWD-64-598 SS2]|uniref:Sphingolipid long chain base-responsive protein LSP1 n=1 Tax=Coniophora puteana (strain RWD-64-598) TaxID=741705 RepID=A0A5M3N5S2_CONPW|nr:uncharacterized protein CONPUDRAFT_45222 [Coniophora puteana RWD-64-598 SS2]EIW86656.1 hypothetical protein CONPUDRAFT_45222 [Coniophora puteana RWD-64-598 SS2]